MRGLLTMTTEMALPGMTIWDDDDDMKGERVPRRV